MTHGHSHGHSHHQATHRAVHHAAAHGHIGVGHQMHHTHATTRPATMQIAHDAVLQQLDSHYLQVIRNDSKSMFAPWHNLQVEFKAPSTIEQQKCEPYFTPDELTHCLTLVKDAGSLTPQQTQWSQILRWLPLGLLVGVVILIGTQVPPYAQYQSCVSKRDFFRCDNASSQSSFGPPSPTTNPTFCPTCEWAPFPSGPIVLSILFCVSIFALYQMHKQWSIQILQRVKLVLQQQNNTIFAPPNRTIQTSKLRCTLTILDHESFVATYQAMMQQLQIAAFALHAQTAMTRLPQMRVEQTTAQQANNEAQATIVQHTLQNYNCAAIEPTFIWPSEFIIVIRACDPPVRPLASAASPISSSGASSSPESPYQPASPYPVASGAAAAPPAYDPNPPAVNQPAPVSPYAPGAQAIAPGETQTVFVQPQPQQESASYRLVPVEVVARLCWHCGAQQLQGARFCHQCAQPQNQQ